MPLLDFTLRKECERRSLPLQLCVVNDARGALGIRGKHMGLSVRADSSGAARTTSPTEELATGPTLAAPLYRTIVINDSRELGTHLAAWQDLAANAVEANPFYEPWMLLPAVNSLKGDNEGTVKFLLIYRRAAPQSNQEELCAFLPLVIRRQYFGFSSRRLPIRTLSMWRYRYCYLGTPLIRRACAAAALDHVFAWFESGDHGCKLVELPWLSEGAFDHVLVQRTHRLGTLYFIADRYTRAAFQRTSDFTSYCRNFIPRRDLREARRRDRLLKEEGTLELRDSAAEEGATHDMLQQFLDLESRSWKGAAGCALACDHRDIDFFRAAASTGLLSGRLRLLGLYLNGQPIAMKCLLVTGEGGFSFKISYDPHYAKFGPGVLLELSLIERLHEDHSPLRWIDSCASFNNPMFNRLYNDRRIIHDLVIGVGYQGQFLVALMPLVRLTHRLLFHRRLIRAGP